MSEPGPEGARQAAIRCVNTGQTESDLIDAITSAIQDAVTAATQEHARIGRNQDRMVYEASHDRDLWRRVVYEHAQEIERLRGIEERAKHELYVAGCVDDGINPTMRLLWRVLDLTPERPREEGRG